MPYAVELERLTQNCMDFCRHVLGVERGLGRIDASPFEQNDELVAAQSGDSVALPHRSFQALGHLHQEFVTDVVPVSII